MTEEEAAHRAVAGSPIGRDQPQAAMSAAPPARGSGGTGVVG